MKTLTKVAIGSENGEGGRRGRLYTLVGSRSRFSRLGKLTPQSQLDDPTAAKKTAGAIGVVAYNNFIIVTFFRTIKEARGRIETIAGLYQAVGRNSPLNDTVFQRHNAILEWDTTPTAAQRSPVEQCLC